MKIVPGEPGYQREQELITLRKQAAIPCTCTAGTYVLCEACTAEGELHKISQEAKDYKKLQREIKREKRQREGPNIRSSKAKGRKLQNEIVKRFRLIGQRYGLVDGDIRGCPMGSSGVDVIFSPAAEKIFQCDIEAKNREQIAIRATFFEHYEKYKERTTHKLLIHKANQEVPLVTLTLDDFMGLLDKTLPPVSHSAANLDKLVEQITPENLHNEPNPDHPDFGLNIKTLYYGLKQGESQ